MTKINDFKSDVLVVTYHGKKYTINVTEELSIKENSINSHLKEQPSNYGFLCLLRDNAIYRRDKLEKDMDAAYSETWLYYKDSTSYNNDYCDNKARTSKKYRSIQKRYLRAAKQAAKLTSVCKAYETRERIVQSLNANLRKQQ